MERGIKPILTVLVSVFLIVSLTSCGGGGGGGTTTGGGTTPTLSGTVAAGKPIASVTVTIKDKNGNKKTATTDADGKYQVDVTNMTAPFLLKVTSDSKTLYSVATATGTANIHPFTDLIIRNWYKVNKSDVDAEFGGTGALSLPSNASEEIATIESVVRNVLKTFLFQVGVDSNFNLITSSFDANGTGFDKVLDNTKVTMDNTTGQVTVTFTDPETGIGGTTISTNIATDLTTTDTTKPSDPSGLAAIPANSTSIVLVWNASTDNIGVAGYNIYRGGSKVGSSPYPVYSDTGLNPSTQYCYQVEAYDGAENISAKSSSVCATTPTAADTTKPTAPTGLTATAISSSRIDLSWTASTDDTGVVGYLVYRETTKIGGVTGTNYSDIGLSANTQYCYTVRAFDAAGNLSDPSKQACATTTTSGGGAKFPIATTTGNELAGSASFDGTNYLVGIEGDATFHSNITAQLMDSSGNLIGSRISTGRTGGLPGVVFTGTYYLMVWSDDKTYPNDVIYGMVLSKSGQVVKEPFPISITQGDMEGPFGTVCRKNGRCSVIWEDHNTHAVYGRDLDASGNFLSNEYQLEQPETGQQRYGGEPYSACDNNDNCLVVYDTGQAIRATILSPTGAITKQFTIATKEPKVQGCTDHNPSPVAFDGTNYLVVWNDHSDCANVPTWDILAQRVDTSGNLVGNKFQVNDSTRTNRAAIPFLAFDGTNFLVVWTDARNDMDRDGVCDSNEGTCWDIYGQYISKSGTLVGSEFVINNDPGNQLGILSGFANGKYLVFVNTGFSFYEEGILGGDVYGVFITP